jgi:hypothetical protein
VSALLQGYVHLPPAAILGTDHLLYESDSRLCYLDQQTFLLPVLDDIKVRHPVELNIGANFCEEVEDHNIWADEPRNAMYLCL